MGTRGAYGYRVDGVDKVTYKQFDCYPDALGATMAEYVGAHSDAELAEAARRIVLVTGKEPVSADLVERYRKHADEGVSTGRLDEWYVLLREAQGEPERFHEGLDHMIDGHDFLADSLFCEWAYIVNIDDGLLEVYKGFNKDPRAKGRYAALEDQERLSRGRPSEYFGVALAATEPFAALRGLDDEACAFIAAGWDPPERDEDAAE
jgi:hypothetical protein